MRKGFVRNSIVVIIVLVVIVGLIVPPYNPENIDTYFNQSNTIHELQTNLIFEGMSYGQVIRLIGKANRDIGSGFFIVEYDCRNGDKFHIWLKHTENKIDPWVVDACELIP